MANTFSVTSENTIPDAVTLETTSYVIQYNTIAESGQSFTWARTYDEFTSTLDDLDFPADDTYSNQANAHAV